MDVASAMVTARVSDGAASLSPIVVALALTDGVEVTELSLRRPTLDDVFLSVTSEAMSEQEAATLSAEDLRGASA